MMIETYFETPQNFRVYCLILQICSCITAAWYESDDDSVFVMSNIDNYCTQGFSKLSSILCFTTLNVTKG